MLTLTLFLIPIFAGILLLTLRNSSESLVKNIALIAADIVLLLAGCAFYIFPNRQLSFRYAWMPDLNINFDLGIDGISLLLMALTAFLVPLILLATSKIEYKNRNILYALILFTEAALIGVFTAKDAFLFYFFYEIALVPVYFIATIWGGQDTPRATFKMFIYTIFGSLFMLLALVYLYMKGGTADIQTMYALAINLDKPTQLVLFAAFFVAFAVKIPIFLFHAWQADAYTESPTPATMLLSGLLSKMGIYGLIRFLLPLSPIGVATLGQYGMGLAIIGLIYGSIIAIQQNNIKRLIAYSSFAHMGLMAAGVLSGTLSGVQGAIVQMLAHGINAVGLFFIAKIIYDRTGTRDLRALGGITKNARNLSIYFMIIMLGSIALPLTNGFVGEFLLLKGIYDNNIWLGGVAASAIIFGAVYMLRLMQRSMFGNTNSTTEKFEDVADSEVAVLLPIAILVILMGLFPNIFLKITEPAVNVLLHLAK